MADPLSSILLDLIIGFTFRLIDLIGFAALKTLELFGAIGGGFWGFVVGIIVLSIVAILILKFIFHSAFTLIILVLVLIFMVLAYGYFNPDADGPKTATNITEVVNESTELQPVLQAFLDYVEENSGHYSNSPPNSARPSVVN